MKKAPPDPKSFEEYYLKLNAEVLPAERDSFDFKMIEKYSKNTAPNMKISIAEVFKVTRQGEKDRYEPFKKLCNRMLL